MKRKLLSLLLALTMTVSLLTVGASAVEPTYDDIAGHWAEASIERWSGHGIIQGNNGKFNPNGQLTCAHFAAILARLLKLPAAKDAGFSDNTPDAWHYDAINRCAAAGILKGNLNGTVTPNAPITRERAMVMLGRALGIEPIENPDLTQFTDGAQVASYARGMLAALIKAGVVGGVTADQLAPQNNITRAATVTILDRAIGTYADKAGATVKADGKGIVLVVADDVTVTGSVDKLLVPANDIEVTVKGSKNIDDITVSGDNSKVILDNASADNVTLDGEKSAVETKNGAKIDNVIVTENAPGANVNVGNGTTIKNVENHAEDATVTGSGTVKKVESDKDITVKTKETDVKNIGDEKITVTDKSGKDTTIGTTGSGSSTTVNKGTTSSGGGGYSHSHSYVYTDNGDGTHTGRCYANDSTLAPEAHSIVGNQCTLCGATQTDKSVASVNTGSGYVYYDTLAAAVNAAADGATVTLMKGTEEDITVSGSKALTIDLNGMKLTNNSGDTIVVEIGATLTVTGSGTVDNVTHGKAAIYNNGTVILNGGSYTRSAEASTSIENANGNSYYNILNHGTMTIEENVSVISSGSFSSLIANGYFNFNDTNPRSGYVSGTNQAAPSLTINGGTFSGGINTIKNDDNATLTVNNGSFSNMTQAAIQNNHVATINGGAFDANAYHAIENRHFDGGHNTGSVTVTNGVFIGGLYTTTGATWNITGGTFSSDPTAYVAEGYITLVNNNTFTVSDTNEIPVTTATVQNYLDGKYGSINGKTLVLGEGSYEKIEFGRATAYAGSNTEYYLSSTKSTPDAIKQDIDDHPNGGAGNRVYVRNMSGVTLKAAEGAAVTINGLVAFGGQVNSTKWYSRDFVADRVAENNNTSYYIEQKWSNITFEGLTFTDGVNIEAYERNTRIDNVNFNGCKFNVSDTETNQTNCIRLNVDGNQAKANNLVVENCEFTDGFTAVLTDGMPNVTVTGSTFSGLTKHAINPMMNWNGAPGYGEITVTGNTFKNMSSETEDNKPAGTILRMGEVGAGAVFTIQNNTATEGITLANSIKVNSLADDITYNISGNNWGSLTASDSKLDG